jgi:hypothetical protein
MWDASGMPKAVRIAQSGLQGWRAKVADAAATPVSDRTPLTAEQVRAGLGAVFFVLSVMYVVKTARSAARELQS